MATTYGVNVAIAPMDRACRATLTKMLANGWTVAQTLYQTSQQVLSLSELSHLLRHGGITVASEPIPALKSFTASQRSPQSGIDVGFVLNVDLI